MEHGIWVKRDILNKHVFWCSFWIPIRVTVNKLKRQSRAGQGVGAGKQMDKLATNLD